MQQTFIGVADTDQLYRSSLIGSICARSDRKVIFCAANGKELIEEQQKTPAQVVIVELYLPVISGIEAIKILRKTNVSGKILAVSAIFQPEMPKILMELSVDGYCSKSHEDILNALDLISQNKKFFDQEYYVEWGNESEKLILDKKEARSVDLKPVEINIIQHTCEGKSNKEIGKLLSLSKRTIDTYTRGLLIKLNLKTKIELVNYAMNHGVCRVSCENSTQGFCACQSLFV